MKKVASKLLAAVVITLGALMLAQAEVSQIGAYGPCQSNNKIISSNISVKYASEKNRGKLEEGQCDVVIHRECTTSSWHETGLDACMWSWTCIWGYYVEEEREVTCTYTCENGYMYTRTWTENEWHQKGCCWLGGKFAYLIILFLFLSGLSVFKCKRQWCSKLSAGNRSNKN